MNTFKVYRLRELDGRVRGAFERAAIAELDAGEVVIGVAYSSVNYKDALAATGAGRIVRRFPCIGGIDLSGTVVESADARFKVGDAVVATGYDIGVSHDGGYAEFARMPAGWVVPLPEGLTLAEAMAIGTAGYTAALAITQMERHGLTPASGPVIVTGATGGVGSIAIDILAALGHHVVALTGKPAEKAYLEALGAKEILLRSTLDLTRLKPLGKATWAGAVDNLGGDVLAWLTSTMQIDAPIAAIGLAAGMQLNTTVAPFILRGVSLLGVSSGTTPMPLRQDVWNRLATDMRPRHLQQMTRTISFDELPAVFDDFLQANVRGRIVVSIGA